MINYTPAYIIQHFLAPSLYNIHRFYCIIVIIVIMGIFIAFYLEMVSHGHGVFRQEQREPEFAFQSSEFDNMDSNLTANVNSLIFNPQDTTHLAQAVTTKMIYAKLTDLSNEQKKTTREMHEINCEMHEINCEIHEINSGTQNMLKSINMYFYI